MDKLGARAAVAVGAIALPIGLWGMGVATADDFAGHTYADVTSWLNSAGLKGVVASRVGSLLRDDDCIVTRSQDASWMKGPNFLPVNDTVLLFLNCNAAVASANEPGNSSASPEGTAAKRELAAEKWRSENPDWCAQAEKDHPEWFPLKGCPEG